MNREPVVTAAAIAGIVMAFLAMAVSLNWLALTPEQMETIQAFILPALGLLLPVAAALFARSKVTPVAAPKAADGTPAVLVPADLVTIAQASVMAEREARQ